jgi:hypothetical protein
LPYLDLTSSRVSRESGEIVLQTTVADVVPLDPETAPARPLFAWWFSLPPEEGTGGGGDRDRDRKTKKTCVRCRPGSPWQASAFEWVNQRWVHFADLQHDISGNTVTVRVPAGLLPLNTDLLWSTTTGFLLGDDPEAFSSEVDWIPDTQLVLESNRIYLPIIRRNS